jgi:hypothetical protein
MDSYADKVCKWLNNAKAKSGKGGDDWYPTQVQNMG